MFTNSTDAYQSALKIMGHEYANKYANVTYTIPINSPIIANSGFSSG